MAQKFIANADPYATLGTETKTPGGGTGYSYDGGTYTKVNGGFSLYEPVAPTPTYGNMQIAQMPVASSTDYRDTTKQNMSYLGSQTTPQSPQGSQGTPPTSPLSLNISTNNQAMQNILKQTNELLNNPEIQKILTPEQVKTIGSIQGLELKNQNLLSQAKSSSDAGQYGTFNTAITEYKGNQAERDKTLEELTASLNPLRERYMASILPGAEEQAINEQLLGVRDRQRQFNTSLDRGAEAQYGTGIALDLASGGEAQLRRRAQFDQQDMRNEESLLLDRLGLAQESRKLTQQGLEKGMEFMLQDYEIATKAFDAQEKREQQVFDNALKLDTQQRQQFADMLDVLEGVDPNKLTPEDEATIANAAKSRGLSYELIKQGLQVSYDKQSLDAAAKKAGIQYQNAQTRKVLNDAGDGYTAPDLFVETTGSGETFEQFLAKKQQETGQSFTPSKVAQLRSEYDKKQELTSNGGNYMLKLMQSTVGGKKPNQVETLRPIQKSLTVINQLTELSSLIKNTTTDPIIGSLRSMNPYDFDARAIQATLQATVPNLARGVYGEVGVLTDADIRNYIRTLPNIRSTKEQNDFVMGMTLRSLQRGFDSQLEVLAAAGYDISGFNNVYQRMDNAAKEIESNLGMLGSATPDEETIKREFDALRSGAYSPNSVNYFAPISDFFSSINVQLFK